MLKVFPKAANGKLSAHFNVGEFKCPCTICTETTLDTDLVDKLETMRAKAGPLRITSGYRCSNYQTELRLRGYETALGVSQHELGRAADVMRADEGSAGIELEALAREAGFTSVGVGHSWIHVDLRPGYRRWTYEKR